MPVNHWVYDSRYASRLRDYAASNQIQILIINIDAFNKKDIAVIHNERDQTSGRKPIEFIQACNPVVILDEPQNMETDIAKEAIASLNPLCTLRYSATHRNPYRCAELRTLVHGRSRPCCPDRCCRREPTGQTSKPRRLRLP